MKKILVLTALFIVAFGSNGCSSGGDETQFINRITLVVDGITKRFTYVTIDQSDADYVLIRGQIGSEVIESISIEIARNVTGTSAVNSMIFTQNNIEYYAFDGSGVYSNVTENGTERKLRGNFSGMFKTLSGGSKLISNGSFKINY